MSQEDSLKANRRRFIQYSGAAGAIAGLAGCSGGSTDGGGQDESTPAPESTPTESGSMGTATPEPQQFSTQIGWSHYPAITVTSPIAVGLEKGMWENHGLTVEDIVSFGGGGTTIRGLSTGGIGVGGSAFAAYVKAFQAGAPIFVIGMNQITTAIDYHTRPDSEIESIQDVKGKKIAVSNPGSSSEAVSLGCAMAADGMTIDDIEIVYAGGLGESLTLLNEGEVAVSWNAPPLSNQMVAAGDTRRVWWGRDFMPKHAQFMNVASHVILEEELGLPKAWLRGLIDTFDFYNNNQEESARIWAEVADIPEDLAIRSVKSIKPAQMFDVKIDETAMKTTAEVVKEQGIIDSDPPWGDMIRQDALPEDKRVDWF